MRVPFGTISITEKSKKLINECLDSKRISCGKYVREFEEKFAELYGVKEAVAVSSGTDADTIALAMLKDFGVKNGDEVILPALSFIATRNAVLHAGLKPVFVDIDYKTLNIKTKKIEEKITDKTKIIFPVHLMGKPCDMDEIKGLCKKHHLYLVEDCAEAHNSKYKGQMVGTFGDAGAFSLYIAHIITTGEGGIIITNDSEYAEVMRSLRSHGKNCNCKVCISNICSDKICEKRFRNGTDHRFLFDRVGYSSKMNELEACIGIGNLEIYQEILDKRRENLLYMLEMLQAFDPYITTIQEEDYEEIGPHAVPIICGSEDMRNEMCKYLEENGIETRTMFTNMYHPCIGFENEKYEPFVNRLSISQTISKCGFHIGVHQDLTKQHLDYVIVKIDEFIKSKKKEFGE